MSTPTLPDVLRQLACLAEVRGAADAADLRAAVSFVDALPPRDRARLEQRARIDRTSEFPQISPSVLWRIHEITTGGADAALRVARMGVPSLLRRLIELGAVTHDQAAALPREAGVATLGDLQTALAEGRLRRFPESATVRLKQAADALATEVRPLPLGRAWDLLLSTIQSITTHCPELDAVVPAGAARRFEPLVNELAIVGRSAYPADAIDRICGAPGVDDVLHRTARRAVVSVQQHEVDIRIAAPDEYGSVLFASTGAREHLQALADRRRGPALCAREEDVYAHLGLRWIAPELRHGSGEVEAAARGQLPHLVERSDIRGDLHMHSTYSDGQDPIERMVAASIALGYEYIAITDHSESAAASRTLTLDQLARQRDEIARLREMHPEIVILHGIEVDILPDGRLDFADAILESLDIVLASLHDPARQDGATLTRRCIQAIRHPLVNVITHPANRLVGRREGYPMDYDAIYAAAADTGTALEIDGAPSHLDMEGERARAAIAAGVTVTIDSDCHRAAALERQMQFGVGTARRGWVEARHVLNCRPVAEVRAFIEAKRQHKGAC